MPTRYLQVLSKMTSFTVMTTHTHSRTLLTSYQSYIYLTLLIDALISNTQFGCSTSSMDEVESSRATNGLLRSDLGASADPETLTSLSDDRHPASHDPITQATSYAFSVLLSVGVSPSSQYLSQLNISELSR